MDELKALLAEITACIDGFYATDEYTEGIEDGLNRAKDMIEAKIAKG